MAEPAAVEDAPVGTAVQQRDEPEATVHRGRAESHDPELTLQLGVGLGESVRLEVGRGAVAQLVHRGDVRLALGIAAEVLHEHDAVTRGLVDLGARRVGLPLVVAVEQIRDAVLRELRLELSLVARHVVCHGNEVLVLAKLNLLRPLGKSRRIPLDNRLCLAERNLPDREHGHNPSDLSARRLLLLFHGALSCHPSSLVAVALAEAIDCEQGGETVIRTDGSFQNETMSEDKGKRGKCQPLFHRNNPIVHPIHLNDVINLMRHQRLSKRGNVRNASF